jgi:hypothetical protein
VWTKDRHGRTVLLDEYYLPLGVALTNDQRGIRSGLDPGHQQPKLDESPKDINYRSVAALG